MSRQDRPAAVSERRAYFRVDDAVRLELRPVPAEELERLDERLERNLASSFTVMSSLAAISAEMLVNMRRIEANDPDVAAYLKALDRKIEVLGRVLTADHNELAQQPAHPVNLSAGGMAALVNECYDPGQVLEIRLLLFPSFTGVLMYGDVVDCEPVDETEEGAGYSHRVRLAFTHMREQDRDLIIRHVLRCQGEELRRRSQRTDSPGENGEAAD
ncbi:MAG: PilZ domain-containing protein [Gammaproteobacteria bacterium]|nr:MAG: PilZ domain-containing protein [Gammaproteobacteria bacterium]